MNSTNDVKFQISTNAGSTTTTGGASGSDHAAALSLIQLEELLNGLDDANSNPAAEKTRKKAEASKEELLQDVVELLKSGLSKGLKTDPEQVKNMVALAANTLNQLTKTDPQATGFVVSNLAIAINDFLLENPKDQDKVVYAFSPLIALCGASVTANLNKMAAATANFQTAFAKEDPTVAKGQLEVLMTTLFGNQSGKTLSSLLDSVKGELNSLDASDTSKYTSLVRSLYDILSLTALRNPGAAEASSQTLLRGGFISAVYALDRPQMESLLQSLTVVMREMTNPNTPALNAALDGLQNEFANVTRHPGNSAHGVTPLTPSNPIPGCGVDIVGNINNFLNTYEGSKTQNSPNISTILGMAMLLFQQFEESIAQSQANQDQATIAIGNLSVQSSMDLETQLNTQIAKEEKEQAEAAKPRPWWDFLIEALVALVAVIVSAVTAGVGAAIAAAMVAAFMMSPLGADVQDALAKKIAGGSEQDLYNKYVKEGMSPQAAQEKASEEWNKAMGFAGLIMVVATVIVTAGVGGIGGAAEGVGDAATEGVEDAVTEGTGDAVANTAGQAADQSSTLSQLASKMASYSVTQGLKVGLTQGLSMLATLDPMMNFLLSDPAIANNQKLVEGLSVALEVITVVLTIGAGCWAAASSPQALSEAFSSLVMPLVITNGVVGMGSSAYNIYSSVEQSKILAETADIQDLIGQLDQALTITQGVTKMNEQTETNINTADTSLINTIGSIMSTVENMAGQPAAAANQVLAG